MHRLRLGWGVLWRMTLWGLGGGAILGSLYGLMSTLVLIAVPLLGFRTNDGINTPIVDSVQFVTWLVPSGLAGMLLGGMAGTLSGLISGLVLAVLLCFFLRTDARHYRGTFGSICGGTAALVTLWGTIASGLPAMLAVEWAILGWFLWCIIPASLASVAAWRAGDAVWQWVEVQRRSMVGLPPLT